MCTLVLRTFIGTAAHAGTHKRAAELYLRRVMFATSSRHTKVVLAPHRAGRFRYRRGVSAETSQDLVQYTTMSRQTSTLKTDERLTRLAPAVHHRAKPAEPTPPNLNVNLTLIASLCRKIRCTQCAIRDLDASVMCTDEVPRQDRNLRSAEMPIVMDPHSSHALLMFSAVACDVCGSSASGSQTVRTGPPTASASSATGGGVHVHCALQADGERQAAKASEGLEVCALPRTEVEGDCAERSRRARFQARYFTSAGTPASGEHTRAEGTAHWSRTQISPVAMASVPWARSAPSFSCDEGNGGTGVGWS